MKKTALSLIFLTLATLAGAQTFSPRTDTFVFNSKNAITSWDGSDPANPPYPYEMGSVNYSTPSPGIDIPWQLGYLNNGFLEPCDVITWGPKVWVVGDGTHSGDSYTLTGTTTCPYFTGEYGSSGNSSNILDGFSVTVTYVRTFQKFCGRYRCQILPVDTEEGGTGTAEQTLINP